MDNFVDISGVESSFYEESRAFGVQGANIPDIGGEQGAGKVGQYLTPENIAMAGQIAAGAFNALGKTEQQKLIKSACGRRPLIGKQKKAAYEQCVANLMGAGRESTPPPPPPGMSKTTKIIIYSTVGLVVLALVIFLIIKLKKK
jgi:hypothetical protein